MVSPSWTRFGAALLLTITGSAAAHAQFLVPRDSFFTSLSVIALAPLSKPSDLEDAEPVIERFTRLLEAELQSAGLTVILPEHTAAIWDSARAAQGGLFDPVTGELDREKAKQARLAYYQEVATRFNANAVLFSGIGVATARLDRDWAHWHGTRQRADSKKLAKAILGQSHSGSIGALSFFVTLATLEDTNLYRSAGGVQVFQKVGPNGKLVPIPRAELFLEEDRNVKAVRIALDPLLNPTRKK